MRIVIDQGQTDISATGRLLRGVYIFDVMYTMLEIGLQ